MLTLRRTSGRSTSTEASPGDLILDFSRIPTRELGVYYRNGQFILGDLPEAEFGIQVPDFDPVELDYAIGADADWTELIPIARGERVGLKAFQNEPLRLRTLAGRTYLVSKKELGVEEDEGIQFYSCFISYSSKDEEFAHRLHARLQQEHVRVWFAPADLQGGEALHDQIDQAIRIFDKLLILLSPASLQSEWVMAEIRKARKAERKTGQRKLFPIRLVDHATLQEWECFDADSKEDIAREVRQNFIPDFTSWKDDDAFEAAFARLLKSIRVTDVNATQQARPLSEDVSFRENDTPPPESTKRIVRYFVSCARVDSVTSDKLIAELNKHIAASKDFEFQRWKDTNVLIGEYWHEEIQRAVYECDFGLLLLSPAFLGSNFISGRRLPQFVNEDKLCLPVGLCRIDFDHHDLKGLEEHQIYLHAPPRGTRGVAFDEFGNADGQQEFAYGLYARIIARLKKYFADKSDSEDGRTTARPSPSETINNLPPIGSFRGREKELQRIADVLQPHSHTWGVLVWGPAGIGKTTLAIRAAEVAAPQFDRVIFLASKNRSQPQRGSVSQSTSMVPAFTDLMHDLAQLLGLPHVAELPQAECIDLITAALESEKKKFLFVFDRLENLGDYEWRLLIEFLESLQPLGKAILASRRPFRVEHFIPLEGLEQAAASAYLEILAADQPLLATASAKEREQLCGQTGGNPLLLRWVAGLLGRGSVRSISAALELCSMARRSHDPIEFILGDLLETLTTAETQSLAALTYFTQGAEANHLAEVAGLSSTAALNAIKDLTRFALVVPDRQAESFAIVSTVSDLLRMKRPDVVAEAGRRLEERAYALIRESSGRRYEQFAVLEAVWPGVVPAIPLFLAGPNQRLQQVCDALFNFLEFKGRWDVLIALNQQAEEKAVAARDHENAAWRACHAGIGHYHRRETDAVLSCADRALAYWQRAFSSSSSSEGERMRAHALLLMGRGFKLNQDYSAAITAFQEVLVLHRRLPAGEVDGIAVLSELADAEWLTGVLQAADAHFQEALSMAHQKGDASNIAALTGNLANLALARYDFQRAESLARESLRLSVELGRQEWIAESHRSIAEALVAQGRAVEAVPYAGLAVEIFTRLNSPKLAAAQATLRACEAAAHDELPQSQDSAPRVPLPPASSFKVALSMASSSREIARSVAEACEARLGRGTVYFNEWYQYVAEEHSSDGTIQEVFANAQMIVLGVDGSYSRNFWGVTGIEALRERLVTLQSSTDARDRLRFFPIRIGEGELADSFLRNTVILDARERSPEVIADMIVQRLAEIEAPSKVPAAEPVTLEQRRLELLNVLNQRRMQEEEEEQNRRQSAYSWVSQA
ncbi:TIR domain-containing protein [Prosthecobacter sp.]|uniref:TIR domain-containing protein n=1 Tax=Prosthecobacter sp. TaxID=1965333 RepID=UPI0037844CD8